MFSNPTSVVKKLGIMPGMTIADIGSGTGEYSIALAKATGHPGRIYAIDVQKDMLAMVKKKATQEGIGTIEVVWGDIEKQGGAGLADNSVDISLLANTLFQLEDKKGAVQEVIRITKPNGKIVIVDWMDSFGGLGPKKADVVSSEVAEDLFKDTGFGKVSEFDAGDHHYGLIMQKKTS